MQWTDGKNAGFSEADSAALYSAVIVDPPYGFQGINVAAQERVKTSLLRWMRRLVGVRKEHRAFGRGTFEPIQAGNKRVLVFMRRFQGETLLCVNNLSRYAQFVELDLAEFHGCVPVDLWSNQPFPQIGELPYLLTMGPHGFYWFRLVSAEEAPPAAGTPDPGARKKS